VLFFAALAAYFWRTPSKHVFVLLCAEYLVLLPATLYALLRPAEPAAAVSLPKISRIGVVTAFLAMALAVSWLESRGELIPDELAYEFQARTLNLGVWKAAAPPGAEVSAVDTPKPLYFENHILDKDGWFTHYPVGWPVLLAGALRLGIPWAANPLFGSALLLLIAAITRRLFGAATAGLAVVLAVLSPYFWANCIERMSHPSCAAFLAAASLFCFAGLRSMRVQPFFWMFVFITAAFQVRPFTAVAVGGVLALGALWFLRGERALVPLLGLGVVCCAACAISLLAYNKVYSGSYWVSPYAIAQGIGSGVPAEISLSPAQALHNLTHQTRWAVQETVYYTFPFLYLLAGYAVWREKQYQREVRILGSVAIVLVLAYLVQAEVDVEFLGERYYFEGFFAAPILAARGYQLLVEQRRLARGAATAAALVFAVLQILQIALAGPVYWELVQPYRKVRDAAESLGEKRLTVFLYGAEPPFVAKHFNLNRPDWQNRPVIFLVDPGLQKRDQWACLMGRPEWVVVGYDPAASRATKEFGNAVCGVSGATPSLRN
jgi:hypothetical protein